MDGQDLGLAEAIQGVRSELRRAQDLGRGCDVRFAVGDVEVEFAVDASRKTGGEAAIKVLSVLSLGGKGELGRTETHRVKIALKPIGVSGQPFEVTSPGERRPDASQRQRPDAASAGDAAPEG
jgi:hypothetical protein